jgi:hypothetical protein
MAKTIKAGLAEQLRSRLEALPPKPDEKPLPIEEVIRSFRDILKAKLADGYNGPELVKLLTDFAKDLKIGLDPKEVSRLVREALGEKSRASQGRRGRGGAAAPRAAAAAAAAAAKPAKKGIGLSGTRVDA